MVVHRTLGQRQVLEQRQTAEQNLKELGGDLDAVGEVEVRDRVEDRLATGGARTRTEHTTQRRLGDAEAVLEHQRAQRRVPAAENADADVRQLLGAVERQRVHVPSGSPRQRQHNVVDLPRRPGNVEALERRQRVLERATQSRNVNLGALPQRQRREVRKAREILE